MPLLWFAPLIVLLSTVLLYPVGYLAWVSLSETNYYVVTKYVGLANFTELFTSSDFLDISATSLLFLFATLLLALAVALGFALLLHSLPRRAATLTRTVLLLPWTLSTTVVGCLWLWLLNPSYGLVQYGLSLTGAQPSLMLGDPELALWLVIVATAWWSFPYAMVLITAALQSIPQELYEAVQIDGGSAMHRFLHVTWPHILPTMTNAAIALTILYLALVSLLIVMTGGGPLGATTTWSYQIFRQTMQNADIAPAAALSVVVVLVNVCLGVASSRLSRFSHLEA